MLDFTLSEQQIAIQKKAREFALKEVLPVAAYYDELDEIPLTVLKKAFDAGIMNADIPKAYGGQGCGSLETILMVEEISAACPGIATSVFDNSLGMAPIVLSNNEDLKEWFLPEIAGSFKLICFATSEPTLGSDVSGIRCKAEKAGDDFLLTGTKYWITNGGIADYISVFASTDPGKGYGGIGAFLVDMRADGVSTSPPIPKMGQRCSNTAGVNLKKVLVPKDRVIAPPGEGFVLAMKTFARTRPAIGALAVGAARSAMEFAIDYAKKRRAFGSPLSNFQAIQFKLAEMYEKVETARLLTWKAAWAADRGEDPDVPASLAKMYATEACWEVVSEALQIFAGFGYTRMFPVEKLLRDTRLFKIYEGTSEIQRLILSGVVLNAYQPVMPPLEDLPVSRKRDLEAIREAADAGLKVWRCRMCGNLHFGEAPPDECPYCFFPGTAFKDVTPF